MSRLVPAYVSWSLVGESISSSLGTVIEILQIWLDPLKISFLVLIEGRILPMANRSDAIGT